MTHYSAVLIIPADLLDKANALGAAMGHGPESYSVPLSDGEGVTHFGARARVLPAFSAMLAAAGRIPQENWPLYGLDAAQVTGGGSAVAALDLAAYDLTEADRDEVITQLIFDIRAEGAADPRDHFVDVCAVNGLTPHDRA
ncbi:hypothetical protein CBW24_07975 [Pacificitalea manganoxidans]|uniref:Uncharacterized protein n=1 Tax=Pacificitalea manganoxidans TaxID=1411902 RepID=A0A291LYX5_9RHOB|nr:hypothetical protein [Pacificitalea manganoxidans]ATI41946.1 hypothetical protein CBW24_07975 [Pacificitalea manganoxidans]MDR6309434.1 hypothetical protein [Pacificitalea manganoxidans]